jgi:hypothetical protein
VLFCRHGDAAAHGALRRLRLEQGRLIEEKGVGGRP